MFPDILVNSASVTVLCDFKYFYFIFVILQNILLMDEVLKYNSNLWVGNSTAIAELWFHWLHVLSSVHFLGRFQKGIQWSSQNLHNTSSLSEHPEVLS